MEVIPIPSQILLEVDLSGSQVDNEQSNAQESQRWLEPMRRCITQRRSDRDSC
jgi:hypothetical protein